MTDEPINQTRNNYNRIGMVIIFIALMIMVGGFGFGYFQLLKVNSALAAKVETIERDINKGQTSVSELDSTIHGFEQKQEKIESISLQQEQLIKEWQDAQKRRFE